jgi:hypothetical protein
VINSDYNMLINNDYMAGLLDWSNGESTGSTMVCSMKQNGVSSQFSLKPIH